METMMSQYPKQKLDKNRIQVYNVLWQMAFDISIIEMVNC